MAARKRSWLRHPRTRQELIANEGSKYDLTIRAARSRKRLPCARWDQFIRPRKSWKDRRKTQYRSEKLEWHYADLSRTERYDSHLTDRLDRLGYWYETDYRWVDGDLSYVIYWKGKDCR